MKHILIVLALTSASSIAGDFSARVQAAKQLAESPLGQGYNASLEELINLAMSACDIEGATLGEHAMVADVTESGNLDSVEIEPQSNMSACLRAQFRKLVLPRPPASPPSQAGWPIVVEWWVID